MHAIFDSHENVTNHSDFLVVSFNPYYMIMTHASVGSYKIIRLTVGQLFQILTFQSIYIYAVANDKIIYSFS